MLRFLLATTIVILLAFTAMPAPGQTSAATPITRDPAALLNRIKAVTEQLDLTPDQKTQIEAIFKQSADDLQSATADLQNASADEKTERYREILTDLRQQVGEALTPDQRSQLLDKLQALRSSTTAPTDNGNSTATPPATPTPGQRPGGFGKNGKGGGAGGLGMRILDALKTNLAQVALSADQQAQVDSLLSDGKQQIESIRAEVLNGSLDRDAGRQKGLAVFGTIRSKLANILTPDQLDQLRQLMQQSAPGKAHRALPTAGNAGVPAQKPVAPQATTAPAVSAAKPGQALAVGQPAPDFQLKTLDGERVGLSSYNHKLLVLVLGSYTNPTLRDRAAGLESLRERYTGDGVNFLIVYTRETHPAGGWEIQRNKTDEISIPQPSTEAERESIAERAKSAMNLSILMAPDTMDDKTATTYAVGDGVAAYLIGRDGKILFHQSWLEPMALEGAIENGME
jgi:Spy/CpxP family protein refolding chaperone